MTRCLRFTLVKLRHRCDVFFVLNFTVVAHQGAMCSSKETQFSVISFFPPVCRIYLIAISSLVKNNVHPCIESTSTSLFGFRCFGAAGDAEPVARDRLFDQDARPWTPQRRRAGGGVR